MRLASEHALTIVLMALGRLVCKYALPTVLMPLMNLV